MADKTAKNAKNIDGKFYVDTNCISCGQCVAIAPKHFSEDPDSGNMYVSTQPDTDEERALCKDAMENCPVESIGDDGDE